MSTVYFYHIHSPLLSPSPPGSPSCLPYDFMSSFFHPFLTLTCNSIMVLSLFSSQLFHVLVPLLLMKFMAQDLVFISCCEMCVGVFIHKYRNTICSVSIMLCVWAKNIPSMISIFKILSYFITIQTDLISVTNLCYLCYYITLITLVLGLLMMLCAHSDDFSHKDSFFFVWRL